MQAFAGCLAREPHEIGRAKLALIGLPDDSQSSYRPGCAEAPARIRAAYNGACYNACTELGVDLSGRVADLGDQPGRATWEDTANAYRLFLESVLRRGSIPFVLGGDHAVTVPVVAALAVLQKPIHVVQFDAHPDLYDVFEENRWSHACTAARLLEMPHVRQLTQVGVRTFNPPQRETAERFAGKLQIVEARRFSPEAVTLEPAEAVYLSVDVDVFDPAFAPGVSHPVPGGLSARQVLDILHALEGQLVGMDVVEVNPRLDRNGQTAVLAGLLLHEGMGQAWTQLGEAS